MPASSLPAPFIRFASLGRRHLTCRPHRGAETPTERLQIKFQNRPASGEHDVAVFRQRPGFMAKDFAKKPLGPVSLHGISHPLRGNDAHPPNGRTHRIFEEQTVDEKGAAVPTPSVGAHCDELGRALEVLCARKAHHRYVALV